MFKLQFSKNEISSNYIGGNIYIDAEQILELNEELIPFLTISPDFYNTTPLKEDEKLTIFLHQNLFYKANSLAVLPLLSRNQMDDKTVEHYYKIVKYKVGEKPFIADENKLLPQIFIKTEECTDEEFKEELLDEINGSKISKWLGRHGFIKDEIFIDRPFEFEIQLFENDLVKIEPFYNNCFGSGALYYFQHKNIKRIENGKSVGTLFIQHKCQK